jgi:acetylornithine deacetylase/succinyl-diaminopimelate desuccinylase-like protein
VIGPFPEEEFLALHRRLARVIAPSNHEGPRRQLLAAFLDEYAIAHRADHAGNLIAALGSGPWDQTVVLDAHLDVVERGGGTEVRNDGERLVGLGVGDDLAAVAMLALALVRLAQSPEPLPRPLVFLFTTGEEGFGNLRGVRQFVADRRDPPYAYLAFDGTRDTFSLTGIGSLRYELSVQTPGGHSWAEFGAPNAIELALDFLVEIRQAWQEATEGRIERSSYNIGTIEGGQGINSIARHAKVTFEFRSVSPEILARLDGAARTAADRLLPRTGDGEAKLQLLGERPAGTASDRDRLTAFVRAVQGDDSSVREAAMSTNINVPLAHGWPAVCMGLCQCGNAHREDEYVRLDSLPLGWHGLERLFGSLSIPEG